MLCSTRMQIFNLKCLIFEGVQKWQNLTSIVVVTSANFQIFKKCHILCIHQCTLSRVEIWNVGRTHNYLRLHFFQIFETSKCQFILLTKNELHVASPTRILTPKLVMLDLGILLYEEKLTGWPVGGPLVLIFAPP
jgi:hypothetical protein